MKDKNILSASTEIKIHFYDMDPLNIVWHGNYVKYLEVAREAFGEKYGIGYQDIYDQGFIIPIADLQIKYLKMVKQGEALIIDIRYIPTKSAKLVFEYTIFRKMDHLIVAQAKTTQLFVTLDGELQLSMPDFYRAWKSDRNI